MEWEVVGADQIDAHTLYDALALRAQVFVVEQDCVYCDVDGLDLADGVLHVVGRDGADLAAYARVLPPDGERPQPRIGRVVVAPAVRGRDLGRDVVRRATAVCVQRWPEVDVVLAAQAHLRGFYESVGYTGVGEPFDEDGIRHLWMRRAPAS